MTDVSVSNWSTLGRWLKDRLLESRYARRLDTRRLGNIGNGDHED